MILLLLLVPLASARFVRNGIIIGIKPGPTAAETAIAHRGTDIKLLTEQEQNIFHLTKDNIKKAVATLSHQKPTKLNVFTQAAPGNHFYKINNWREVKRNFQVKSMTVANVTVSEAKQSEKMYTNNGTNKRSVQAYVYEGHISFNSSHRWTGNINVSATVRYRLVRPAKENLDYSYSSEVGSAPFSSGVNIVSIGNVAAKFDLNAGQSAVFVISARVVTTKINVKYETTLIGDVVVRYAEKVKGKEFWALDVNKLLRAMNVTTVVHTNEFVKISYIKDYVVTVIDSATGKDIPYTNLVTPHY